MRFAQIKPGAVIDGGRRTVTEVEIIQFAKRYDPQWFHTDPDRAAQSRWKGLISSGWLTCSIAMELAVKGAGRFGVDWITQGVEQLKWLNPVRPGDELTLRIEVLEVRT